MFNPNPRAQRLWMHQGARLGGIVIAGRCILVFMFFGFGLMLMGIIAIATSSGFDNFQGKGTNPPRTVGICFLTIGGALFVSGIIFLFIAKRAVNQMSQGDQNVNATSVVYPPTTGPVLAGGGPYTPVPTNLYQPYPPNQYQQPPANQYPPQPGGQYQQQQPMNQYPPQQGGPYQPQQPMNPYPSQPYQPQQTYPPNYIDPKGQPGLPYPPQTTAPPAEAPPAYHM